MTKNSDSTSKKTEAAAKLTDSVAKLFDSLTRFAEAEFKSSFGKIDLVIVVIALALVLLSPQILPYLKNPNTLFNNVLILVFLGFISASNVQRKRRGKRVKA